MLRLHLCKKESQKSTKLCWQKQKCKKSYKPYASTACSVSVKAPKSYNLLFTPQCLLKQNIKGNDRVGKLYNPARK